MNLIRKIINVLYFIFISIIALHMLKSWKMPEVTVSECETIQEQVTITLPTEKELEELKQSYDDLLNYLEQKEVVKDEIATTYAKVTEAQVCSIANRNFNTLAEQYEEYIAQISEIQEKIEEMVKRCEQYLSLLDDIPEFSKALKEDANKKFREEIVALYKFVYREKQKCKLEKKV